MTNHDRLVQLKRQRELLRGPEFRTSVQARRDILSVIVPLLNFNDAYYSNAFSIADVLGRPGFSSNFYDQAFAQIDSIVNQAINELQHGLTHSESATPAPEAVATAEKNEKSHPIVVALIGAVGIIIVALVPIMASRCQAPSLPRPTPSPTSTAIATATPPKNFITVVSIAGGTGGGEYFDFEPSDMDAALESKVWDHQALWASQTIEGTRKRIWVVRGCSSSPTNACGRYDPKGKSGDFFVGENLYVFWTPQG